MRIIAISDIHGNLVALEAVIAAVGAAPDLWVVAGDLVAFGPQPAAVIDRVRSLGGTVVKGNLDDYTADPGGITRLEHYRESELAAGRPFRPVMPLELIASQVDWTRSRLDAEQLSYLSSLPLRAELDLGPGGHTLVLHANARDLERPLLPGADDLPALAAVDGYDLALYGHVHVPAVWEHRGCRMVNVASVGFPTDGMPMAAYTEILCGQGAPEVRQHRVGYDLDRAEAAIRQSGLPHPDAVVTLLRTARRVR